MNPPLALPSFQNFHLLHNLTTSNINQKTQSVQAQKISWHQELRNNGISHHDILLPWWCVLGRPLSLGSRQAEAGGGQLGQGGSRRGGEGEAEL